MFVSHGFPLYHSIYNMPLTKELGEGECMMLINTFMFY
jgi:hypothetical protein